MKSISKIVRKEQTERRNNRKHVDKGSMGYGIWAMKKTDKFRVGFFLDDKLREKARIPKGSFVNVEMDDNSDNWDGVIVLASNDEERETFFLLNSYSSGNKWARFTFQWSSSFEDYLPFIRSKKDCEVKVRKVKKGRIWFTILTKDL